MRLLKNLVLQKFQYLFKRFIALWTYVIDIPILLVSLFSVLITFISFRIYKFLEIGSQNLRVFIIFLSSILIITLCVYLLYIWKFSQSEYEGGNKKRMVVQILFLALILVFRVGISFTKEYQTSKNAQSFTEGFTNKNIQILDIDRSEGDNQEIIYLYQGIRGVGYVNWFENLKIGDMCNTNMEIKLPENFSNFDYIQYLKNKNIYFTSPRIEINNCSDKISIKKLSDIFLYIKRNLMTFRKNLSRGVEKSLPEPQASLLIGILFGSSRAFSDKFEESLRISGTTHIIAASGYNITILILVTNKMLNFLNKKLRLIFSLLIIWLYCILSGLGASILRATMMGTLTILSLLSGNVRNTHILVPTGVFFLILMDPKILFDIGFQLSILATLGLIYIMPSIENLLKKTLKIKSVPQILEDNLLSTISCTLSTLPISISIFGKLSLVSIFANVLILPLTESTMLYGTIALIGSFMIKNLSKMLFSVAYVQLKLFQTIVEFFGSIEWGYIDISASWIGLLISLFLILFASYFYPVDQENYYVKRFKDI